MEYFASKDEHRVITAYCLSRALSSGVLSELSVADFPRPRLSFGAFNIDTLGIEIVKVGEELGDRVAIGEFTFDGTYVRKEATKASYDEAKNEFLFPSLINEETVELNSSGFTRALYLKNYNFYKLKSIVGTEMFAREISCSLKQGLGPRVYEEVYKAIHSSFNMLLVTREPSALICKKLCDDWLKQFNTRIN